MAHAFARNPSVELDPSTWLERYGDILFRYAVARVRDEAVAEDLVQETLLAAIGAAETFKGRSTERTWLIGILRHKVLDCLGDLYLAGSRLIGRVEATRAGHEMNNARLRAVLERPDSKFIQ